MADRLNLNAKRLNDSTTDVEEEHEGEETKDSTESRFLDEMDSYRALWCRTCYVYDCSLHSVKSKPSLQRQIQLALQKETPSGPQPNRRRKIQQNPWMIGRMGGRSNEGRHDKLSNFESAMYTQLYTIFQGQTSRIASVLQTNEALVKEFIEDDDVKCVECPPKKARTESAPYYSVRNYNQKWYREYANSKSSMSRTFCLLTLDS